MSRALRLSVTYFVRITDPTGEVYDKDVHVWHGVANFHVPRIGEYVRLDLGLSKPYRGRVIEVIHVPNLVQGHDDYNQINVIFMQEEGHD